MLTDRVRDRVRALAREHDAVILAHNYQRPEVQDLADAVGDSLALCRQAAATDARTIVMCGVRFMAETAAVLCPGRTVLIPAPAAGCSLATSIDAARLREWRASRPGVIVVCYVNTDAATKAESDICCTSGNALAVVTSIPPDEPVLVVPDNWLGSWLRRETGRRNLSAWPGECHVHAAVTAKTIVGAVREHPEAEVLVHPECRGLVEALDTLEAGERERVIVASTEGMIRRAVVSPAPTLVVGTEQGLLHRLARVAPDKVLLPLLPTLVCEPMKLITPALLAETLETRQHAVTVPETTAARARAAIERMLAVGRVPDAGERVPRTAAHRAVSRSAV
jgi:quinolinate synthase